MCGKRKKKRGRANGRIGRDENDEEKNGEVRQGRRAYRELKEGLRKRKKRREGRG